MAADTSIIERGQLVKRERYRARLIATSIAAVAAIGSWSVAYASGAVAPQSSPSTSSTGVSSLAMEKAALATGNLPKRTIRYQATKPSGAHQQFAKSAATTVTGLGNDQPGKLAVDGAHQHVFISIPAQNSIQVADLTGKVTSTITGLTKPDDMVLSPDSSILYVQEDGIASIAAINTSTFGVTQIATPSGDCPEGITYTGSKVWLSYTPCSAGGWGGFVTIDPANNNTASQVLQAALISDGIAALPDQPNHLITWMRNSSGVWVLEYDATQPTPTEIGSQFLNASSCGDLSFVNGGSQILVSCFWPGQYFIFNTSDLSPATGFTPDAAPMATAVNSDGTRLALGLNRSAIEVNDVSGGLPGTEVGEYETGDAVVMPRTMAWDSTNDLFAVSRSAAWTYNLQVLPSADRSSTTMSLIVPSHLGQTGNRTFTGALKLFNAAYDGQIRALSISRRAPSGTTQLASVNTDASGAFSFQDNPPRGRITYTVTFAGDSGHSPATQSGSGLREVPFDLNGDGYADMVVGSPLEDLGTSSNAGTFHVLYSHASGVTGTGSVGITQDTAGVPGVVEKDDQFGWSNASGDFNGDGYADLAMSSNAETVGSVQYAGTVTLFYGSASGIKLTGVKLLQAPFPTTDGFFGETLSVGDYNGDGLDDLAMSQAPTNEVFVATGSTSGLQASGFADYVYGQGGLPGLGDGGDLWGFSLSSGDVNGDGRDDLAVGAPFDMDDHGYPDWRGSATVIYGSATGLTATLAQRFTEDTAGVPGVSHMATSTDSDEFGYQVALGDYNGDGKADLVVSTPGAPVKTSDGVNHIDAGNVTVLYSSGSKIGTTNAALVTQSTTGMPGSPGKGDAMGVTLAVGDSNGDNKMDLAIFSLDGYVTIVKGGSSGLSYSTAVGFTQSSSGIAGTATAGDDWGLCLRFESFKGGLYQGLVVGAPGKHNGAGSVTAVYSTSSGLTGTGSAYFDQNSSGVSGSAEAGDEFGSFYSD